MNTVKPLITNKGKGITQYTWRFLRKGDIAMPVTPEGLSSGFGSISIEGTSVDNTTQVVLLGSNDERNWYTVRDIRDDDIAFTDTNKEYREFCSALLSFRPEVKEAGSGSAFEVTLVARGSE